jgi:two-component system CheB/CheR fusion protein
MTSQVRLCYSRAVTGLPPPRALGIAATSSEAESCARFLAAIPRGFGLSYLVAGGLGQAELALHMSLPIRTLEEQDSTVIEADTVYLVPSAAQVTIEATRIRTRRATHAAVPVAAADDLFVAVAQRFGDRSLGLVMNIAELAPWQGLEAIERSGGLTLAIASDAAEPSDHGASLIDHYLPDDRLADELIAHIARERVEDPVAAAAKLAEDVDACMPQICDALLRITGQDFRHYKRSTLVRRTVRRLQVLRLTSAGSYVARLADDRGECERLFRDLLINVTAFFRDPDAFEALATLVIRPLLERDPPQPLRIWVPGCATGEEAYSIAMLVLEQAEARGVLRALDLQLFATDLDEVALAAARQGMYPPGIASEVGPRRLEKFFTQRGQHYQVTPELRERVLFSLHNLINDPPFSKVDLISCRNLLIYLGSHLQEKLVPLFHYALSPGGYLFLGPSESLEGHRELFRTVDQKHRISQRLPTVIRSSPGLTGRYGPFTHLRIPQAASTTTDTDLYLVMQRIVLDEFAPKAAVVDDDGHVVCASGNLEKYVAVEGGPFQNSITRLVRPDLRVPLRGVLREAAEIKRKVVSGELALSVQGGVQRVSITAQPMPQLGDQRGLYLVVFSDIGEVMREDAASPANPDAVAASLIERLERDLHATRRDLESSVQDLEAANEELQSSNEELQSSNEELQSANEELETSKEELRTTNTALVAANEDLENLMASTRIATIFLDENRALRRFTPDVTEIYNVRPTDIGRPLEHYTHRARSMPPLPAFDDPRRQQEPIEDEVELEDGRCFLRMVSPYRTTSGDLHGLVLTFLDITQRRRAAHEMQRLARDLAHTVEEMQTLLAVLPVGIGIAHDAECRRISVNPAFAEMLGIPSDANASLSAPETDRPTSFQVVAGGRELPADELPLQIAARTGQTLRGTVADVVRADGVVLHLLEYAAPLFDDTGRPRGSVGAFIDVTEQRATLAALERRERELRSLADNIPDVLLRYDRALRHTFVNRSAEVLLGRTATELLGTHVRELPIVEPVRERMEHALHEVFEVQRAVTTDYALADRGAARSFVSLIVPEHGAGGGVESALNVMHDRTAERLANEALREADHRKDEFLAMLAHELRNPLAPLRSGQELLQQLPPEDPRRQRITEVMGRQLAHITRLVDDLLDVSRISRGKLELKREIVDLQSIIGIAVDSARPLIDEARHELVISLPERPILLDADPARLTQLFGNLLTNAAKYTAPGGTLRVEVTVGTARVEVSITDTGYGIQPEQLPRLFEMFTQVTHTKARAQGGLGIGLALVRRLAELHGGTVTARSPGLDRGSTFSVDLPLHAGPRRTALEVAARTDSATRQPQRVLVIDDNHDAAEMIAELLGARGHEVQFVTTGEAGLAIAPMFMPDVVLLDIGLPDVSGYDVGQRLRELLASAPLRIVALTGWGAPRDQERSRRAGFDHHLTKPVSLDALLRLVEG